VTILRSERLILRPWRDEDLPAFAAMNADARVMEFFPNCLARTESDDVAARIRKDIDTRGWGFWALEVPGDAPFIGFTGLSVPRFSAHFTPCVEIGWRLSPAYWRQGYATEAARAAIDFAARALGLNEIVAFAVPDNHRSRAVMARLGMTHDARDDFDHPLLPESYNRRRHVLYRLAMPRP